jgi:hypothetical protein
MAAGGAGWAGNGREGTRMTENRGPDPQPTEDREPDPKPPEDDIRWLIYLGIGMLLFLGLVAWSSFHNAMGH